ncbi:MAG: hypothetical protein ABSH50_22125 [Bryobacteraceae bacterium]
MSTRIQVLSYGASGSYPPIVAASRAWSPHLGSRAALARDEHRSAHERLSHGWLLEPRLK